MRERDVKEFEADDKRGEVNATLRGEVMGLLDIDSERKTRNGPGMTAARGTDIGNQSEFNRHAASALRDVDCAAPQATARGQHHAEGLQSQSPQPGDYPCRRDKRRCACPDRKGGGEGQREVI